MIGFKLIDTLKDFLIKSKKGSNLQKVIIAIQEGKSLKTYNIPENYNWYSQGQLKSVFFKSLFDFFVPYRNHYGTNFSIASSKNYQFELQEVLKSYAVWLDPLEKGLTFSLADVINEYNHLEDKNSSNFWSRLPCFLSMMIVYNHPEIFYFVEKFENSQLIYADVDGNTLLHYASVKFDIKLIEKLLEKKLDPTISNDNMDSAFALMHHTYEKLKQKDKQKYRENLETISLTLIKNQLFQNNITETCKALYWLCRNQCWKTAAFLINNTKFKINDLKVEFEEVKEIFLLTLVCSKEAPYDFIDLLLEKGFSLKMTFKLECLTPFNATCEVGNLEYSQFLLKKAKANEETLIDSESLYYAIKSGNINLVKFLLNEGAKINNSNEEETDENKSPILAAIEYNQIEILELLIKEKVELNPNYDQYSPLAFSIYQQTNRDIFRLLLKHGALITEKELKKNEQQLLSAACRNSEPETLHFLIEKGASINDENINVLLHEACKKLKYEIVIDLLQRIEKKKLTIESTFIETLFELYEFIDSASFANTQVFGDILRLLLEKLPHLKKPPQEMIAKLPKTSQSLIAEIFRSPLDILLETRILIHKALIIDALTAPIPKVVYTINFSKKIEISTLSDQFAIYLEQFVDFNQETFNLYRISNENYQTMVTILETYKKMQSETSKENSLNTFPARTLSDEEYNLLLNLLQALIDAQTAALKEVSQSKNFFPPRVGYDLLQLNSNPSKKIQRQITDFFEKKETKTTKDQENNDIKDFLDLESCLSSFSISGSSMGDKK